ncbi:MAG: DUF4386 family protein [Roseiflexaceae bacterium]|nr:DUF4386 family protein [Roseiflexaceae bacterium]
MTVAARVQTQVQQHQHAAYSRAAGGLMVAVTLTFLVTLAVLSTRINWPASLDEPASVVLPRILEQRPAVMLGYGSYLLSSLLMIPMALLVRRALDPARASALLGIATTLGVLAGVVKPLGILRWLSAMPALAAAYTSPMATPSGRESIEIVYTALNAYAGTLGEILGVAVLGGGWLLLLGCALVQQNKQLLGWSGVLVGLLSLVPLAELFGANVGLLITLGNAAWYLWVLAAGVALLAQPALTRARSHQ